MFQDFIQKYSPLKANLPLCFMPLLYQTASVVASGLVQFHQQVGGRSKLQCMKERLIEHRFFNSVS